MSDINPTELAAELHRLAEFVERHPEVADELTFAFDYINVPVGHTGSPKASLARFIRAATAEHVDVRKDYNDTWGGVRLAFGRHVKLNVYTRRELVCERVVVGTETVTEEVPDPEALAAVPKITQTREVEKVEWRCEPLLAGEAVTP